MIGTEGNRRPAAAEEPGSGRRAGIKASERAKAGRRRCERRGGCERRSAALEEGDEDDGQSLRDRRRRGGGRNSASFPRALPAGSEQAPAALAPPSPPSAVARAESRVPAAGWARGSRPPASPPRCPTRPRPRRAFPAPDGPVPGGGNCPPVPGAPRVPGPLPKPWGRRPPAAAASPPFTLLPCTSAISLSPAAPSPLSFPLAWYLPFPASRPSSASRAPSSRRSILRLRGRRAPRRRVLQLQSRPVPGGRLTGQRAGPPTELPPQGPVENLRGGLGLTCARWSWGNSRV